MEAGAAQALSAVRPRAAVCPGWLSVQAGHFVIPMCLGPQGNMSDSSSPLWWGWNWGTFVQLPVISAGEGQSALQGGGDLFSPEVWPLRDIRDDGGGGRVEMAPCPGLSEHRMPELLWVSGAHLASLLG